MGNNASTSQAQNLRKYFPELFSIDGKLSLAKLEELIGKENIAADTQAPVPSIDLQTQTAEHATGNEPKYNDEEFRLLAVNSTDVIWTMDLTGRYLYVSPSVLKLRGFTPEENMQQSLTETLTPDSAEYAGILFREMVNSILSGEKPEPRKVNFEQICKDGSTVWTEISMTTVYDDQNNFKYLLGVTRNIDERKKAEDALRISEERLHTLINASPDFICFKDETGRWQVANEAAIDLLSLHDIDFAGKTDSQLALLTNPIHINSLIGCQKTDEKAWQNKGFSQSEEIFYASDNTKLTYDVIKVPVYFENKERKGLVIMGHNITEHKTTVNKLRTVARLYSLLSQINQAILRTREEQELFETICETAIKYGQFRMAWIGIKTEAVDYLKPVTHAGYNEGYLDHLMIVPNDQTSGKGPSGQAFRLGQISSTFDIASDSSMQPWRDEALKRGYRSSASVPFRRKGKVFGILSLYASEAGFFTPDEQNMLQEIGDNISFALDAMDTEAERKNALDALQKREALFRGIMDASPDDITISSLDGIVLMASKAALEMFGYDDTDEITGQNIFNFIIPEDYELATKKLSLLYKGELDGPVEYGGLKKNGEVFNIEVNGQLIIDQNGIPTQIVFVVRDITQRKLIEKALIESEAKYRELVENSTDAIIVYQNGRIVFVNNECLTLLKVAGKEFLTGHLVMDLVHPDYHAFVHRRMEEITTGQSKLPAAEAIYIRTDGSEVNVEVKAMRIQLGQEMAVQLIIRDITERKQAELLLKNHQLQLEKMVKERTTALEKALDVNRAIVESAGIAIISSDKSGLIRSINPFAESLSGFKKDEIIGTFAYALLSKQQNIIFGATTDRTFPTLRKRYQDIQNNLDKTTETLILDKQGNEIPVLLSLSVLRASNGKIDGFVCIATDISIQKKAEEAIKKNKQELKLREIYLSAIIQNHPGRFWMKDTNGRFLFSNTTNNEFLGNTFGADPSRIIGSKESDLRPLEESRQITGEDKIVISQKKVLSSEEQIQVRGSNHWYEKLKFPVINQFNQTIGVAGYAIDITNRKEQEAQLRMQIEAFESFALSIVITDHEGNIQWANPAFEKLTGYSPAEAISKKPSIFKSDKTAPLIYKELWETILKGHVWSGEFVNKRKDGSLYYEESTITPVRNASGEISRFIAIKLDITHRKEMEKALRLSEERWQFALEGAGDGVWDWNLQSQILYFSTQWKRMLGYDESFVINSINDWKSMVHPEDLSHCLRVINEYLTGVVPVCYFEHRFRCKDNSYKWVLSRGKTVEYDAKGYPQRMLGTLTDITEIKRAEEQLKQSIEREKELNEIKSRLVANASHEFRTPLATILITNDSLVNYWSKMEEEKIKAKLAKIKNNVQHLSKIVDDILQLSKMEEGKRKIQLQAIDIVSLCNIVITELQEGQYKGNICFESDSDSLNLLIDERLMRQAITNLLSNAMKYSPDNTPVNVSIKRQSEEVTIRITDTGIGIPEVDQKHLFTPFFRASNSQLIPGNGLGLNIMRESIRLHGGEVSFISKQNEGTTFTIHLPLNQII